jgi:hypothetical protein
VANQAKSNEGRGAKTSTSPLTWGLTVAGLIVSALLLAAIRRRGSVPESRSDATPDTLPVPITNTTCATVQNKPIPAKVAQKIPTLSGFVEDNEKLVSVLGVFTAISVFVSGLPLHWLGYVLSFLFMILTVILWLELWGRFPSGSGDWKITTFEDILMLAVLALVVYVFVDFRNLWKYSLVVLIYSVALGVFSSAMKRFDLFNRLFRSLPGERRWLRYLVGYVIGLAGFVLALELARFIAPPLNSFLDTLYRQLTEQP